MLFDEAWLPAKFDAEAVVYFDGVCVLCHRAVQLIIAEEQTPGLRFAPLDGESARAQLGDVHPGLSGSIVLFSEGQRHLRSNAALRIARAMGGFWGLFWVLRVVPGPLRDGLYDWVARNRYRWFGQLDSCPLPTAELRARFLD
jgi:predicted DCC family thiol-disulfide oxidoreductase YuxK